jgi:2-polyprenyl-3-methyl-5-hydroxy-6-metoxy-1,4-benzoquinol methylase
MRFGFKATHPIEWLALWGNKIPMPILDVVIGPLQSQALIAAVQSGVFRELGSGALPLDELARRLRLDPECLVLLARVLRTMGYLQLEGGRAVLSAMGERYFGPRATEPYTDFVAFGPNQLSTMSHLLEVLRSGQGIDAHSGMTPEEWPLYQRAMAENASAFSWFVAEHCPVPARAERCLDIAGSHGIVGAALARRHPPLRSTVLERAEAIPIARQIASERGLLDVVEHRECDLLHDAFGAEDADVALLCNILHHFSVDANKDILRRVHSALRPGGTLAVFDVEGRPSDAPADAGGDVFSLVFRISSTSACFMASEYESWLRELGFREVRTRRSIKLPSRMLVIGRKSA